MNIQFFRFAAVGGVSTIATYAVLIFLVELLDFNSILASIAGYIAGAVVNYVLNYRFTFNSIQHHKIALPKFILIIAVGFILNTLIMYWAISVQSIHYVLAQLIAVCIVLIWSFTAHRLWTFV